jgi:VIT1/CCC1 family predicted Fe2+/Mn2+ transporter
MVGIEALALEAQSGGMRAAVLGISDGISTNIALILGVAGANPDPAVVKIAGIASLLAGAFSMAVGEYISMQTQVDLLERVIRDLRTLLERNVQSAQRLIAQALARHGIDEKNAAEAAEHLTGDPTHAIGAYASIGLGINERELGSPWIAASASLVTFAVGAFLPLLPWFFLPVNASTIVSLAIGGAAAFVVGALLAARTNGRWLLGGLRQVGFILLASGITFGVGRLFRVALS